MSDSALTIASLVGMALLLRSYHKESVEEPATTLPLQELVDVRRWRHDGAQPTEHRDSNLHPAVKWPIIGELI